MKTDKPVTFQLTLKQNTRVLAFVIQAVDTLSYGAEREMLLKTVLARFGYRMERA